MENGLDPLEERLKGCVEELGQDRAKDDHKVIVQSALLTICAHLRFLRPSAIFAIVYFVIFPIFKKLVKAIAAVFFGG